MQGRCRVIRLLLAAAMAAASQGQDTKPAPATHDLERSPADLLRESYAAGGEFVPAQRAFLLFRLALVAERIAPDLSAQWAKDLFNLTFELDPDWNRSALQKNAVAVLANIDPAAAFRMLGMMSPLPNLTTLPEDLRADAAAAVFPRYWKDKKSQSRLDAIRGASGAMAKDGQYPFRAVSPVLHDVLEQDEAAGLAWFSEICLAYRQGNSNIRSANRDFVAFVREFWPKLPSPAKREALTGVIGKLTQPDANGGSGAYHARVKTSAGMIEFSSENEQLLFQVMPFVRELDPDWAARLSHDRPALFGQSGQLGVTTEDVSQVYIGGSGSSDQTATAASFLQRQQQLGMVFGALGQGPGQALQIAGQLGDPETQLRALEGIAGSLADSKDTSGGASMAELAKRLLESAKKPLDKVRALAVLAQATARTGDTASFHQYMDRGFDLGELVFEEFVQTHPVADIEDVQVMDPLSSLVATGMRFRPYDTVSRIERCADHLLSAYLLIAAAQAENAEEHSQGSAQIADR